MTFSTQQRANPTMQVGLVSLGSPPCTDSPTKQVKIAGALRAACGGASSSAASGGTSVALNAENTAAPGQELNVASDPKNGGTLHIAMSADPLCLDPHQISSDVEQLL